jgi:DNA-binding transcriptional ArsR family regulator
MKTGFQNPYFSYPPNLKTMASSKAHRFDKLLYEQSIWSKALAHPARIIILTYLYEHGTTPYNELCKKIPLARETVSQHLTFLREKDFVTMEESFPHSYYTINDLKCREYIAKILPLFQKLK